MRRKLLALVTIGILGWAVFPAGADHVQEPTAEVTGIRIVAGEYPGLNQNPIPCDGSVFTENNIRIHPHVGIADRPSEHWKLRVHFRSPADGSSGSRLDWNTNPLFHQNAGPHGISRFDQGTGHWNHYRLDEHPGLHVIQAIVTGDVSGNKYETECSFTIPE